MNSQLKELKSFKNKLILVPLSFYYAISILWTGTYFTNQQTHLLWITAILGILISVFINNDGIIFFPKKMNLYQIYTLLFALFSLASVLWAQNANTAISRGTYLFRIIISMVLVSMILKKSSGVQILLKSVEIGGYIVVLFVILVTGLTTMVNRFISGSRLTYAGINSNRAGIAAAFSIVICVYYIYKDGFRLSNVLIIPSVFIVVTSVSKKAFLIVILGVFLFFLFCSINKRNYIKNVLNFLLISSIFLLMGLFISQFRFMSHIRDRFEGMISGFIYGSDSEDVDYSTYERLYLLDSGLEIIKSKPILGVGLDNAQHFNIYNAYLHNNYLEIFADLGIIGFLIYYAPWIIAGFRFIKYRNWLDKECNICASLLIVFLIMDYGRVSYYSLPTYYFLLLSYIKSENIKSTVSTNNNTIICTGKNIETNSSCAMI